jgi:hypothetical protein
VVRLWHRHAPLLLVSLFASLATAASYLLPPEGWAGMFVTSAAGNVWGVVVLLVVFDLTPRGAQEKEEGA